MWPKSLLLSLALLVGCSLPHKNDRAEGTAFFELPKNRGDVLWASLEDLTTNDLQFVLLLPECEAVTSESRKGSKATDSTYDCSVLKTKRDGHQWKIEADGNMTTGTHSLRFSDLTANTFTNIDLKRSRMWRISDDSTLIPLDKIDPAITESISDQYESFKNRIRFAKMPITKIDNDCSLRVQKCLRDFETIKAGMTRSEVESRFPRDGGIQAFSLVRFVHPACPYFKIDVEFDCKRNAADQNRAIRSKDDKATKISKPYIESPFAD